MEYLIVIAVGWFLVEFEPLHFLIDAIKGKTKNKLALYVLGSFNCWQCMAFWSGLVITGDFITACVSALGSLVLETWLSKN